VTIARAGDDAVLTGLVVGKFCPLHLGHEALFEHARSHCDRLVILSYTKPEFPGCGPARRSEWLAESCPDAIRLVLDDEVLAGFAAANGKPCTLPENDAPDDTHRLFVAWVCQTLLAVTVDRVFTSETYGDGFAAALSVAFGHPVEHFPFDLARSGVPISGTRLRKDPIAHRAFLSRAARKSRLRHAE
jgi:HTH-type transcriptional regulator, transcriptional repressor of NAD biosynthesis genes